MTLTEGDILQVATLVFRVGRDITPDENDNATVTQDACDQALSLMQFDRLIQGDAVIPFYQPIVSISDDSFPAVAYEVLGRSRLIGLTTPGEMFATAAQLNLESELSRIFRGRGVELAREFPGAVCLYVNTHPRELENELVQSLYDLRAQNPDQDIVLEIHEAAVTNSAAIRKLRDALSDLGMGLAFDDFGAGQARLVELSEVQPDCLKFDMGLIQGIHSAPASRQQVVGSLIKMVNDLGIDSLVEGVETKEDHETLRQMGAKLGQGFYYGRPASVSDSIKQLATVAQS
jgi:EAL domain-containing protein (putative c-di-GMP-specific phosphodiesterase class I)